MMKSSRLAFVLASLLALVACSGGSQYADLDAFVAEKRASPSGQIAPIPALKAYRAFSYTASGLRAPFNRPVDVKEIARLESSSNIKPDLKREKEFLEQFSLDSISVVGTVRLDGVLWALVKDPDGGVHRVGKSNYLGRNFGKIIDVAENYLTVVEIVSTGGDGWVERPRTLELKVRK
ncbi:pilus assembly protein PilP [Zhongshania sp. BJYM1]|jgi:type IV pilus assembly protein PilP|uniref:pilus assembly protein PilP n=1 Tax=Zhongshania aquatica TaxID=2965069 RepID=UPI0022B518FA|nr:pilus assembly protein PilP [Marortus sp. BJYM1]